MARFGRSFPFNRIVRRHTLPANVTATFTASLGGLTATLSETPTVNATLNASLGGLTATMAAKPTVNLTLTASLGSLTATLSSTPTVAATLTAPLGGLSATLTYTVVSASGRVGGNLVKPRLHLGNSPGRKQQHGTGEFVYRLSLTGYGDIIDTGPLALPVFASLGEIAHADLRLYRHEQTARPCVRSSGTFTFDLARSCVGVASEDADDLLVLLTIGV